MRAVEAWQVLMLFRFWAASRGRRSRGERGEAEIAEGQAGGQRCIRGLRITFTTSCRTSPQGWARKRSFRTPRKPQRRRRL